MVAKAAPKKVGYPGEEICADMVSTVQQEDDSKISEYKIYWSPDANSD